MSFITRRALSTLIPPKVASPSGLGAAQDAVRMKRVVDFYEKLPRGSAPETQAKGFINKYKAKHFSGDKASAMPIIHVVGILVLVGYAQNYYFHLRHHKNNAH